LRGKIEPIGYHLAGTQRKLEMVDRDCFTVAPFDDTTNRCWNVHAVSKAKSWIAARLDHIDMPRGRLSPGSTASCWSSLVAPAARTAYRRGRKLIANVIRS